MSSQYDELIKTNAEKHGLSPELVRNIIKAESSFNPNAVSPVGAGGLMQLMPATAADYGLKPEDRFDPVKNIEAGTKHLAMLNQKYNGDTQKVVAAYNWGQGNLDRQGLDNAPKETRDYLTRVLGGTKVDPSFGLPPRLSTFQKKQAAVAAARTTESTVEIVDTSPTERDVIEYGESVAAAAVQATEFGEVDLGEAFVQGFKDNVTGALIDDLVLSGVDDEEFINKLKAGEYEEDLLANEFSANQDLRNWVLAARNEADYERRKESAAQQAEFGKNLSASAGWNSIGAGAINFIGQMADPVAIASAVMVGGLGAGALRGAALGATENVAAGLIVDNFQNRETTASDVVMNGVFGAVLGAVGGTLEARSLASKALTDNELADIDDVAAQSAAMPRLAVDSPDPKADLTYPTTLDIPEPLLPIRADNDTMSSLDEYAYDAQTSAVVSRGDATPADGTIPGVLSTGGVSALPVEDIPERPQVLEFDYDTGPTLSPDRTYAKLHQNGLVAEVNTAADLMARSAEARDADIPEDAKAVFLPQEQRVYIFRDRVPAGADLRGLLYHEVGNHYGLGKLLKEKVNKLYDDVLSSNDPRVREALDRVPEDTPAHLRAEEAIGYLAEFNSDLPFVRSMLSTIRNMLRDNFKLFANMKITTDDALTYVKAAYKRAARVGRESPDIEGFVWHGSPTTDIEQLDTKYLGQGEGNIAFGWGHYVSSDRITAVNYRDVLSKRKGVKQGGLYQLRLLADPLDMVQWETKIAQTRAGQLLEGSEFPPLVDETGQAYMQRLTKEIGGDKAAAEWLHSKGVPGVRYSTARTRGKVVTTSNYVVFSNDSLDMAARYSRAWQKPTNSPVQIKQTKLSLKAQAITVDAKAWDERTTPEDVVRRSRLAAWYQGRRPALLNKGEEYLDSPGLIVQNDTSKVARYIGAHIMEDATGLGKRVNDTAAIEATQLHHGWAHAYIPRYKKVLVKAMTKEERAGYIAGGSVGEARVNRLVAEERLRRREAVRNGRQYQSQAPKEIQELADTLDQFYEDVLGAASASGVPQAAASLNIKGAHHGFMPYHWDWMELNRIRVEEPKKWNDILHIMTKQYRDNILTPAINKLMASGPVQPQAINALMKRVTDRVEHLVSVKMNTLMESPEMRVNGQEARFQEIAEELLLEKFDHSVVTPTMAEAFKRELADIIKDRSRTEMDLMMDSNGTKLLDIMKLDALQQMDQQSRMYSGLTGLARKGYRDMTDVAGALQAARADGADPLTIQALDFGFRALGMGSLNGKEHAFATALRDGAHMTMMGKLGFSILAELPAAAANIGKLAMIRSFPLAFRKSPLMRQIADVAPALAGLDHRIQSLHAVEVGARDVAETSSKAFRALRRGRQATDYLSLANTVSRMAHRMVVPAAVNEMMQALLSKGGLSPERMADAGLDSGLVARISAQVKAHDPNYKLGDEINLDKWSQYEADQFLKAAHRLVGNSITRAHVGERPMWQVENGLGTLVGQFKGAGFLSAEKQLMRNVALGDAQTVLTGGFALMFGAMLYEARSQASTLGMTDEKAADYMEKKREGLSYASGVLMMTNMSGLLPDTVNIIGLLAAPSSLNQSPIAAIGFAQAVGDAAGIPADLVEGDVGAAAKKLGRIMPGGNSIPMLWGINSIEAADDN